ncbi:MAG: panC [Ilumatobacteraceae bacterium]|nr:panC [Ilumatobacteraceae bacterium]
MLILDTPASMRAWSEDQRRRGATIGLVPTMGALHDGHLALVDAARARCDVVVVSIFVNPLQFNRPDDFELYPRPLDDDLRQCERRGVTAMYAPSQESMYPAGFETFVEPGSLAEPLEGVGRPGHFRGVTTVVAKLFNAVAPSVAVFGRKDFQQLALIERMVADLDMPIEIIGVETVREPDGLAMSSRNRRLTDEQRRGAVVVPRALDAVVAAAAAVPRPDPEALRAVGVDLVSAEPLARLEYLELVDPVTLREPAAPGGPLLAVTAVWFDGVRLIDNRAIPPSA